MRVVLLGTLGAVLLALVIFTAWMLSLPRGPGKSRAPPIPPEESAAALAALAPRTTARPLIAIVGINHRSETTDYLMPYGILKRAEVADVVALSTEPGPVELYPALTVEAEATVAEFDARHPDGADYVIVPAMEPEDDPAVLAWIRAQSAKSATIIGVCAGALVVGNTGLLDHQWATTHWFYRRKLFGRHPEARYLPDRRIVVGRQLATTTGVSASMPAALTLVEVIAGRERAGQVAADLGVEAWDAEHASNAFRFNRTFALTVLGNVLAFWRRDRFAIELVPGMDEVSLALVADAWSRTYRSHVGSFSRTGSSVRTRSGLRIVPDRVADTAGSELLQVDWTLPPADALDEALKGIEARYGARTASVVAMQLEYPRGEAALEQAGLNTNSSSSSPPPRRTGR
jgi:transcriptional regulator GlxA family with amidase domain